MDAVRIFEDYCNANGIQFEYGDEAHLNLIKTSLDPQTIYLLLFPITREAITNSLNTGITGTNFQSRFMLVVPSDFSLAYFSEKSTDPAVSKYTTNIEPLIAIHKAIGNTLLCQDIVLNTWRCVDAINVLDANKDGIWCTFNFDSDER